MMVTNFLVSRSLTVSTCVPPWCVAMPFTKLTEDDCADATGSTNAAPISSCLLMRATTTPGPALRWDATASLSLLDADVASSSSALPVGNKST